MAVRRVKVWEAFCTIPTYRASAPEKSPLFLEKRAYQGSTGKVYPLAVTEKISDEKEDVTYRAVFLENDYLNVMILPELGGRIHRAYDKTNGYDFVYYNHVIKPALVGLTGPWISGGIEFNWPQHHRPSTFSPVDNTFTENADGSCTVYVSEVDKMYGTKGMAAISLYPDYAYIEIRGQLYNQTDLPQTFLWWANPAVPVNNHTYSVFPPDVTAVMDHGKRAVSTFPIATGEYYKADYSAGVDISRYKNIKVPTSYMAAHSDYDFIGNYDESREAGLLHIADHHISPGKKQWTWGNGDFGRTWDRNLTETDGPYIELMTGVFTDNQPDFTWLKPQEEKTFVQYFMPYKGVGRVGNATKEAAVSLQKTAPDTACVKVYSTCKYPQAEIVVTKDETILHQGTADLTPENCVTQSFSHAGTLKDCTVTVTCNGAALVSYKVYPEKLQPVPEPAKAFDTPENTKSLEELYLAATHLEQYRHASCEPADYYREGLRRDSTDIRLNNGYGLLLYKRGQVAESIRHFQTAIEKQTRKNPNPYTGECYFNLGLALETDGQYEKAYDAFYKSTWSAETQSAGFYHLACLSARNGAYNTALEFVEKSKIRNWHNMQARNLEAALLRRLGKNVNTILSESLAIDPLHMGCLYEKALLENNRAVWQIGMRAEAHNYLTVSLAYCKAGLYTEALDILSHCEDENPMIAYYKGFVHMQSGKEQTALSCYQAAEAAPEDYCFPNRIAEQYILSDAIKRLGGEAPMAHYYLGNLLYDKKQYEKAVFHWEQAVQKKPQLAMAHRNLSIAYYNKEENAEKAFLSIEKAFACEKSHPRFLLEYDQLSAKRNVDCQDRLHMLQAHMPLVTSREDLFLRYITLLNTTGNYTGALSGLHSYRFHPWEGAEGKVSAQYRFALIQLAKERIKAGKYEEAITLLTDSLTYPENLGEGKLPGFPDNETYYYMGIAFQKLGDTGREKESFLLAAQGDSQPSVALYYNEQPSDYILFQGLANRQLGNEAAARKAFHKLLAFGEKHLFDTVSYDFFAVSLPEIEVYQEDLQKRNRIYCNYLRALGYFGLTQYSRSDALMKEILAEQCDYQYVKPF